MSVQRLTSTYAGGDRIRLRTRGHSVLVDQPADAGGDDSGPSPVELFVGSLVTCMTHYAQRFLWRNSIDPTGLELTARYELTHDRPYRVSFIDVEVTGPVAVPEKLRQPLRRVMMSCTVHNSLDEPPAVTLTLDVADAA